MKIMSNRAPPMRVTSCQASFGMLTVVPILQLRDRLNGHGLTAGDAVKLETNVS